MQMGAFVTRIKKSIAALILAAGPLIATATAAAEWRNMMTTPVALTVEGSVGARFWYGWGKTGKDLSNIAGTALNSRLTYDNLHTQAFEAFGRVDSSRGWYLKGYAGGGVHRQGPPSGRGLPPGTSPYSSTDSNLSRSTLIYGSIDLGMNILKGGDFRVGAFAGYHFLREEFDAYGCTQTAGNPTICAPGTFPAGFNGITQKNNWHSLRVGFDGDFTFAQRWKLGVDAAWLPYVRLFGTDTHWARVGGVIGDFTGPIPEDGIGWGYQFEGALSYMVTPSTSIGAGVRYWHMEAKGSSEFEGRVVGVSSAPQPVTWKNDVLGFFVQGSLKFGPY